MTRNCVVLLTSAILLLGAEGFDEKGVARRIGFLMEDAARRNFQETGSWRWFKIRGAVLLKNATITAETSDVYMTSFERIEPVFENVEATEELNTIYMNLPVRVSNVVFEYDITVRGAGTVQTQFKKNVRIDNFVATVKVEITHNPGASCVTSIKNVESGRLPSFARPSVEKLDSAFESSELDADIVNHFSHQGMAALRQWLNMAAVIGIQYQNFC